MPRRKPSRGSAPVEFILSLPLVLILWMAVLTGAAVLATRVAVSYSVRREAWLQRHGTPPAGSLAVEAVGDVGIVPGEPPSNGLIEVEESRQPRWSARLLNQQPVITMNHDVMGGSWDFQTIPFVPRGPLQPDPRSSVYAPGVTPSILSALARELDLLGY